MMDTDVQDEKKKLFGKTSEKTFQFDDFLPNLPVPQLEDTLKKYLESVKPFVNENEYDATKKIVTDFQYGIGEKLQLKLLERSTHHRNWLEKWWLDVGYLTSRLPILPLINVAGCFPHTNYLLPPQEGTQIQRAAFIIYYYMQYWRLLQREVLPPQKVRNKLFSMDQWRYLFNCCRIPGLAKDSIVNFFKTESEGSPGPIHLVVLHHGYAFMFDAVDVLDVLLTPPEIESQLQFICDSCKNTDYGPSIGSLTCDDRTSWHMNREQLIKLHPKNEDLLHCIESALFVVVLDEEAPTSNNDAFMHAVGGDVRNRWADKSLQLIVHSNGLISNNIDHAPSDAMVLLSVNYYTYLNILESNLEWLGSKNIQPIQKPQELKFEVDDLFHKKVEAATALCNKYIANLNVNKDFFFAFGKEFMTKQRKHPDSFVQLSLQLAYYRQHYRPAPTYETASTRQFYHGRTETVRSCTSEAVEWVKCMLNPSASLQAKLKLMDHALEKHNSLMNEAMENEGCDRHLFGLYLTALEEGEPVPELYTDSSYVKSGGNGNFILSTSLGGYTAMHGGVAPMIENGYGVFYSIQNQSISFVTTAWKSSEETDVDKFYKNICLSLIEMQRLLLNSNL